MGTGRLTHACAAALTLAALAAGCVKRPVDYEREYARSLAPRKQEAAPARAAETLTPVRVRIYADTDYREQVLRWDVRVSAQLRRASAMVEGPLGVRFELESVRPWPRRGAEGLPGLQAALEALRAHDAGEDVDLVLGFVTGHVVASASHHDLGIASLFGRHAVLRSMDSPQEAQAITAAFTHLPADEKQALYRERLVHKEAALVVHEWAHTLGAFHVQDTQYFMAPGYSVGQAAFAPATLRYLQESLRHAAAGRKGAEGRAAWARALLGVLDAERWPAWDGPEQAQVRAHLQAALEGRAPVEARPLPPADRKRLEDAMAREHAGQLEVAAQMLAPLVARHPDDAQVQALDCHFAARIAPEAPGTRERCEAAVRRFPGYVFPQLTLAQLDAQRGDAAAAARGFTAVRTLLEQSPAEGATGPGAWAALAANLRQARFLTWAEEAAARASGDATAEEVQRWATQTRRYAALPRTGTAVAPEREPQLLLASQDVQAQLERNALGPAGARLAALARDFPQAGLVRVLRCELELRRGRVARAREECRAALRVHPEAVQAHFLLAYAAVEAGAAGEAREHLERVVELGPENPLAWPMLAKQYQAAGDAKALAELKERHRQQFGKELR